MRRRLGLLVAATMCLVLLAFLVPLALLLRTVARDRAVVAAGADAQDLVSQVGTESAPSLRLSVEQRAATAGRPVTVFLPDGSILGTPVPPTDAVRVAAAQAGSLNVAHPEGREIVVAVLGRPDGTAVIRTFVPRAELTRGVGRAWLALAALGVALLLLGLLVADRLTRTLVTPIAELATVSDRLARAELTARARPAGPPELRQVATALNHLAGRIQELLREEREQVADLSHRLRTPLTSLRLEAESLADLAEAARIGAGVDALERAVTGLIQQARRRGDTDAACDATAVVRDRVAFWSVLAEDTGRALTVELATGALPVRLPADELAAVVDALLGNVFAHTPDGVPFAVTLAPRATGGAILTVTDRGPGLPALPADPTVPPGPRRVGDGSGEPPGADATAGPTGADAMAGSVASLARGVSSAGSTGLGLDIARRAARTSDGRLELAAGPGGGTRVTVELGPPPAFTSA